MRIERRSLSSGAAGARGVVVIIDVLRAFSCAAMMFRYGIAELVLVRDPGEALSSVTKLRLKPTRKKRRTAAKLRY